jgi:hypothetical protein
MFLQTWDTQIERFVLQASYNEAPALLDRVYDSRPSSKRTLILAQRRLAISLRELR